MPKFFVTSSQIEDKKIKIINEDVKHIKNVLRKQIGEKIEICNKNTEKNYIAEIEKLEQEQIICKIIEEIEAKAESNVYLHIFQGIPKAEKMDLIIQKGVELGVSEFTPVKMKRCVVKLDDKNFLKKITRWQKISEVASKQSGRDTIPQVNNPISIEEMCKKINEYDVFFIAYEKEEKNYIKKELKKMIEKDSIKIGILIGPEGGIEKEEVQRLEQAGGKVISLGKRILRTETVALQVASIIMYELEK